MMSENVEKTYGTSRFPNMELCAKSGTAEVGEGQTPHAWFAGFLRDEDTPYAFVVMVENAWPAPWRARSWMLLSMGIDLPLPFGVPKGSVSIPQDRVRTCADEKFLCTGNNFSSRGIIQTESR